MEQFRGPKGPGVPFMAVQKPKRVGTKVGGRGRGSKG